MNAFIGKMSKIDIMSNAAYDNRIRGYDVNDLIVLRSCYQGGKLCFNNVVFVFRKMTSPSPNNQLKDITYLDIRVT